MPLLAERLGGFSDALLDPGLPMPAGLIGPDGEPSLRRFSVYRNNVVVGLTESLRSNFPILARILGEVSFGSLVRIYVAQEPPVSPVLIDYGDGFAAFVEGFQPLAHLPWLADVARLEWAWLMSYHAAEATPLGAEALGSIPPEAAGSAVFALHPSLQLVRSRFPVHTVWSMNAEYRELGPVDFAAGGEDILILRPDAEVSVRLLPAGAYEFVSALRDGHPLAEAAVTALAAATTFDLATHVRELILAGAIVGYHLTSADQPTPEHPL